MPELPEVETTTRGLRETVQGKKITAIWCDWENIFRGDKSSVVAEKIVGSKFISFERRGKNIIASLSNGYTLIMHMKMTGHFMYGKYLYDEKTNSWSPKDKESALADPYNRFVHVVFSLSNKKELVFCDVRKFGKIELIMTSDLLLHSRVGSLGPEPLLKEFDYLSFTKRFDKKEKQTIKKILLDQSVIAGIGNIYTDESLYLAGIHPESTVGKIPSADFKKLHKSIKKVLAHGIEFGGDSTSDYRNIYGESGKFHGTHKVYRRANLPCTKKACGGIIERIVVANRGTYLCKKCQRIYT